MEKYTIATILPFSLSILPFTGKYSNKKESIIEYVIFKEFGYLEKYIILNYHINFHINMKSDFEKYASKTASEIFNEYE